MQSRYLSVLEGNLFQQPSRKRVEIIVSTDKSLLKKLEAIADHDGCSVEELCERAARTLVMVRCKLAQHGRC